MQRFPVGMLCLMAGGLAFAGTAGAVDGAMTLDGVAAEGAAVLRWRVEELVSAPGAEEEFAALDPASGIEIDQVRVPLDADASDVVFRFRNRSGRRRFLRASAELAVPFPVARWWNGYLDEQRLQFDPDDVSLSTWFPANAALGTDSGLILGIHPMRVYSRVETGRRVDPDPALTLGLPFVLDAAGERAAFELSFVVAATPARYVRRDVVQRYYDLFPEAYLPAGDLHPHALSTQFYLVRNPRMYRDGLHLADLARRFTGGRGAWEWWYAPFRRGGDWATTYEWTEGWRGHTRARIDAHRARVNEALLDALDQGVAPMYYVNILDAERALVEEHFMDAVEVETPRTRRPWGQETIMRVYPHGNAYGALFEESLRRIASDFPGARGVGWDSCFGHQVVPGRVAGVEQTPGRSFRNGEIFALQAAAYVHLLDLNRSHFNGGYRMANAVNLKLVSPYSLGARTDAALYEGVPMDRPERLLRIEAMRARLGSRKPMTWHKHLQPDHLRWIDWADLTPEEVRAAFRQVQDDNLLLSYYWGALPVPGTPTLGVERTFLAVPELVDLSLQGWQPSPAVDTPAHVPAARFGSGLGARIALINPDYADVEAGVFFPVSYWDGAFALPIRPDGQAMEYTVEPGGVAASIRVPARSVVLLRVAALARGPAPAEIPARVRTQARPQADGREDWNFTLITRHPFRWETQFFRDEAVGLALLRIQRDTSGPFGPDEPVTAVLDASAWPLDEQADYYHMGEVRFRREARIAVGPGVDAVRNDWRPLPDGEAPGLVIEVPGGDDAALGQAEIVRRWFRFYTHHALDAYREPPILAAGDAATADGAAVLRIETGSEGLDAHQAAAVRAGPDRRWTVRGRDPGALADAVQSLLRLLDEAYPYVGVLSRSDGELERAGLMGTVIDAVPQAAPTIRPTLLDFMRETKLIE